MIVNEKQEIGAQAQGMPLEVVWRNPRPRIRAYLKAREAKDPYCRWAEQSSKIRAQRQRVPFAKKVSGMFLRLTLRRLFFRRRRHVLPVSSGCSIGR